jgi:surface antigen
MDKDQKVYAKEDNVNFRKQLETVEGTQKMKMGQELIIVDGPWYRVTKGGQQGWVRADFLSEVVTAIVKPDLSVSDFIIGQVNGATSDITKKIREAIKNVLNGAKNKYDLQCTEYVSYRLKAKLGVEINWPVQSGRNGGVWWKIFQTAGIYKVLTEPKINCAMCFTDGISQNPAVNAIGHVAFIEEVFADGSVKVSEANWPPKGQLPQGQYNERVIPKEKWKNQYKAKFVDFT